MDSITHAQTSTIPLSSIVVGYNPRRFFDPAKHDELVTSMKLRGMLQPMLVRPAKEQGKYEIVAGGRRYRAAQEAFGENGSVPVIIRTMSDDEALEAAIDENDVRDNASETEQADAATRVLAACRGDRSEAAKRLGWSTAKLDRRLALAGLSDAVKDALDRREIKIGHAELLAAIPTEKQEAALKTITSSGIDVAKTRELLMKVTQDLAGARFDKSDCVSCPYNAATQRALFDTHVDEGHCTNASCFSLKTEAAETATAAAAEEARVRAEAEAAALAPADADEEPAEADEAGDIDGDADEIGSTTAPGLQSSSPAGVASAATPARAPAAAASVTARTSPASKSVSANAMSNRAKTLREETWRKALARALSSNPLHAREAVVIAAMTGVISQVKTTTLPPRAKILISGDFLELKFEHQIRKVRELGAGLENALSAIAGAIALDLTDFRRVASLCNAYGVDIRSMWTVDKAFLDLYTKDELRALAQECGLVEHMGAKAFGKLLNAKKNDLVAGMLNATGFTWAGRIPSPMSLDGTYSGPAPDVASEVTASPAVPEPANDLADDAAPDADSVSNPGVAA